jgi:hypothetical protein
LPAALGRTNTHPPNTSLPTRPSLPPCRVLLSARPKAAFSSDQASLLYHVAAFLGHAHAAAALLAPPTGPIGPCGQLPCHSLKSGGRGRSRAGDSASRGAAAAAIIEDAPAKLIPGLARVALPGGPAAAAGAHAPGPLAGGALVHAGGAGMPLILADDNFGCYSGATPATAARGACLWRILSVPPDVAARAAAAARQGAAFNVCACVPFPEFRGSVRVKVSCRPAVVPAAAEPSRGRAATQGGPPAQDLVSGIYIVWCDLADSLDQEVWDGAGAPRDFWLLPGPAAVPVLAG